MLSMRSTGSVCPLSETMHINARIALTCLCLASAPLFAQGSSSSSSSSSNAPKSGYVRRFSIGATLGVLGLPAVPAGSTTATSGSTTNIYDTTNASQRIGGGLTGQIAITNHIAVTASAIYRKAGFKLDTTTSTSTTSAGVTTITVTGKHEDTRAVTYEIPVMVRYYVKSRFSKPPLFFAEAGYDFMKASNVHTSFSTIDSKGANACCTAGDPDVANRMARGVVAGLGVLFVDPIGIRVVPEVRYTRWQKDMFHNLSAVSQKNQIEAVISLCW